MTVTSTETPLAEPALAEPALAPPRTSWRARWLPASLLRRPAFVIGAVVCVFWAVTAVCWPLMVPSNPTAVAPQIAGQAPSLHHWFGTDRLGRDVLSRVLAGASTVFKVAPLSTAMGLVLGVSWGLLTGYRRGWVDEVGMRVADAFMTLPGIVFAVVVIGIVGRSTWSLIVVIGVGFAPIISRVVRSAVLGQRERQYVEAARLRGEGTAWILFREILPNISGTIMVEATIRFGYAIFSASALSFLGLGPQDPSPDWGLNIAENRVLIGTQWWSVLFPTLAIASLVIGINLVADTLRQETGP